MVVHSWPWLLTSIGLILLVIVGGFVALCVWAEEAAYMVIVILCSILAALVICGAVLLIVFGFYYGFAGRLY